MPCTGVSVLLHQFSATLCIHKRLLPHIPDRCRSIALGDRLGNPVDFNGVRRGKRERPSLTRVLNGMRLLAAGVASDRWSQPPGIALVAGDRWLLAQPAALLQASSTRGNSSRSTVMCSRRSTTVWVSRRSASRRVTRTSSLRISCLVSTILSSTSG